MLRYSLEIEVPTPNHGHGIPIKLFKTFVVFYIVSAERHDRDYVKNNNIKN